MIDSIDSVESMAENASNALLKTLEEPGNGVVILLSAREERLLSTIRSRCQKIPFTSLNKNEWVHIISNYSELKEQYEGEQNESE